MRFFESYRCSAYRRGILRTVNKVSVLPLVLNFVLDAEQALAPLAAINFALAALVRLHALEQRKVGFSRPP